MQLPLLVRKSDGGYNYATTDLAAIKQRVQAEKADRVLYVTDSGQAQHFKMVFQAAEIAKFVDPEKTSLEHVPFGLVQGEDGKKFATRSGDTVKLKDLLNESVNIAAEDMMERAGLKELSEEQRRVSRVVGVSAVKYADLSLNRESNYRFSYARMLSLQGNTAPYMLYARARVCSIVKKGMEPNGSVEGDIIWPEPADEIILQEREEVELARHLLKFGDILYGVERDLYPNKLCDYLFETSQKFSAFYESCSVIGAETEQLKRSRLTLAVVTNDIIVCGLKILGIETVERM